jgi:hypothetical protein
MRGGIPPGAMVPIHSHDSTGTFLVISGIRQALVPGDHGLEWKDVRTGDYGHEVINSPGAESAGICVSPEMCDNTRPSNVAELRPAVDPTSEYANQRIIMRARKALNSACE